MALGWATLGMHYARVKMGDPSESFVDCDISMLFYLHAKQSSNQRAREKGQSYRPMLCNL